ncbi:MAG: hypothetical protein PHR00_01420 [Patescibacteria group bacterium]|nr:hypothetical protein [Patescibacteria group bacterium]
MKDKFYRLVYAIIKELVLAMTFASLVFLLIEFICPRAIQSILNLSLWFVFWFFGVIITILMNNYD